LVTGGAGFVGSNLTAALAESGERVVVYDNLSRRGAEKNYTWLEREWGKRLDFMRADIRDLDTLKEAVREVEVIYHLAGQVAVTTSVLDPRPDFEVNALGTFNVLEAARLSGKKPVVVFTSTNKVYGGMEDVEVEEGEKRYGFKNQPYGVSENRPLDFHSPYGCSKGAADQYVRDYERIYDIPTVVFRMSCIYGPRQFGNEDQGWVAHFLIAGMMGRPLTVYGNGKQVRDVLFVGDLVRAFRRAVEKIDVARGKVFNIGGGPDNTLSLLELIEKMKSLYAYKDTPAFSDWRPGDQPVYISDIRRAEKVLDWKPEVSRDEGVDLLHAWIDSNRELFA
jgi:CDP-paratose 2-epimerase